MDSMTLHHIEGHIQSLYLAEYPHGLVLLDGGCRADAERVTRFITDKLQRPVTDLKLLVVTHMHPDHAGAARALRKITGCQIASADCQGQWYGGAQGLLMFFTDVFLAKWVARRMGKQRARLWFWPHLKADILLTDGQALPGFEQWHAISTPGHTDRDLSLYHRTSDTLYVADLMVTVKQRYIPPFPIFHPNQYRKSLNKLSRLPPKSILLAHGGSVELQPQDYQYLLDRAPTQPKTHWRASKARLKRLLRR